MNFTKAIYINSLTLLALAQTFQNAYALQTNQYAVWGIDDSRIIIPAGYMITEAVLTITAISPWNAAIYVYLLDDPNAGYQMAADDTSGEPFAPDGVPLQGTYENGDYVCRFSQTNNRSRIRALFPEPTVIRLGTSTTVELSSAILELMDYAGNGKGFGIGIDPGDTPNLTFTGLKLELTIQSYRSADALNWTWSCDLTPLPGDINQDKRVDIKDVGIFGRYWLAETCQAPDYCSGCDINRSGTVDMDDLSILIQNWLKSTEGP